jgi:hypothetical protein
MENPGLVMGCGRVSSNPPPHAGMEETRMNDRVILLFMQAKMIIANHFLGARQSNARVRVAPGRVIVTSANKAVDIMRP